MNKTGRLRRHKRFPGHHGAEARDGVGNRNQRVKSDTEVGRCKAPSGRAVQCDGEFLIWGLRLEGTAGLEGSESRAGVWVHPAGSWGPLEHPEKNNSAEKGASCEHFLSTYQALLTVPNTHTQPLTVVS